VAIGGGVIQDITCFLAATLLRGLEWWFYPTTLLAQADSCIGSKSSINVGRAKNILGTFTPPRRIVIDPDVLATLDERDMRSGYGEMLKVHAITGPGCFDDLARAYPRLAESDVLDHYVRQALEFKRRLIEEDEFDVGVRRVMNYGHTFGHALEAATNFAIPHGIAVTIGMDMANHVAVRLGHAPAREYERMHPVLRQNYDGFESTPVPFVPFTQAIAKDKKHTDARLVLVLPDARGEIRLTSCLNDARFADACAEYLERQRQA
jgi:3-dehydroquinate synthase